MTRRLRLIPKSSDFRRAAHAPDVTAKVGLWLGITFVVCFVTGLLGHGIQHPPQWFYWPSRPVNLYRITQGLHVICGIVAIPLLLAKLWSVFPKLFERPVIRSLPHALERLSILVLTASAFFELMTGLFNTAQNYPWSFFFPPVHYSIAWVAIGAIAVHVAVKLPVIRRALGEGRIEQSHDQASGSPGLSRRAFFRTTGFSAATAAVATAGATVPALRPFSGLSWRTGNGTQGVPVNRTAAAAGVIHAATDTRWLLTITTDRRTHTYNRADLGALPQTTAELPIACVEGWSQSGTWTGVSIRDLLREVGAAPDSAIHVTSLERGAVYGTSTLPGQHSNDPLTLLALTLNGEELGLDHGYPCRIIAPNRPGVLQTKWVSKLEII